MSFLRALVGFFLIFALHLSIPFAAEANQSESIIGARFDEKASVRFPTTPAIINIKAAPYFAKGDGKSDDTAVIQRALHDMMGLHRMLYFPEGTYLISRTLRWSKQNSSGREAWGKNFLQGESPTKTVIRLKDHTFVDSTAPQSIMWCGGFGSADWFHNYVQGITFDVGNNNPGSIGLQFYSNNSGAVRDCRFIAGQSSGMIGLDLGHYDMNGPLLVRNCEVVGFNRGINAARAVNSQTLEHITLKNQSEVGIDNQGQSISIRGLLSQNAVPAVRSYGLLCLLDAKLIGEAGSEQWPAVVNYNGGQVLLRDIYFHGYRQAILDVDGPDWYSAIRTGGASDPKAVGNSIAEYCSHSVTSPFKSSKGSIRLPIEEPPRVHIDAIESWANVEAFGADPTAESDSSAAFQRAMDSGASTVFAPGSYSLQSTVVVPNHVRRIVGVGGSIDYFAKAKPDFRVIGNTNVPLTIEHFAYVHGGIELDSPRTIVFRSVSDCDLIMTPNAEEGSLYFEDFVTHNLRLSRQRVWARQLNVENEGTHIENRDSQLWVLGFKTERGGTLIKTSDNGISEVLGGFSYTTTAGDLAPMFINNNASVYTFFREICFNGNPFSTLIVETQGKETVSVLRGEGSTYPYVGHSFDGTTKLRDFLNARDNNAPN